MTDLEIVKKCAEKMGLSEVNVFSPFFYARDKDGVREFDPLHDDAQAMALVKKFGLQLKQDISTLSWAVTHYFNNYECSGAFHYDLNRAICECVARLPD